MEERYIAFDVETPNSANDRMSAIGITVIENGVIVDDFYSLVNPEARFDYFNIQLTGITPEMAAEAPAFPQLWAEIEPLMSSGVLVAHSAPFDMGVLAKCLNAYGITEEEAATFTGNPIDHLEPIAQARIPLLHVCGAADTDVPVAENTAILAERYRALGGSIALIIKEGCAHHPHSLEDPKPIVDFILKHTGQAGTDLSAQP